MNIIKFVHIIEYNCKDQKMKTVFFLLPFDFLVIQNLLLMCQCLISVNKSDKITIDIENSVLKSKIDSLGETLKSNIIELKNYTKLDVVFLIDNSWTVGEINFKSELTFVKKILSDISVDYDKSRIAIVTFSSKTNLIKNVDQISRPIRENNKCLFLNKELNQINFTGGGTYTLGAFKLAKEIFANSRNDSKKILFLITDGFSNGGNPVPIAKALKNDNVTIFTIGVKNGKYDELYELSSSSSDRLYSFLVDSFHQFESLARRALHVDIKGGDLVPLETNIPCNSLCKEKKDCCDLNAFCTCGTLTGHYSCLCKPGFFGSGLKNSCIPCPSGNYSDGPNSCLPCPDSNHFSKHPAIGIKSCYCKAGYQPTKENKCEIVKCPKLKLPQYGYFVKNNDCGSTLNTACGIRCNVGYFLNGSSIRLCQKNGTWSGFEPYCQVKTCRLLLPPDDGTIRCFNTDVGILKGTTRNRFPVDSVCKFECKKGRVLIGSSKRTCLPISEWDGLQTSCKKVSCNKLSKIDNGSIEPKSCTKNKQPYGKTCRYSCDEGFELVGPKNITCTGRYWNKKKQPSICKDKTPPILVCPSNIEVEAIEDARFGFVSWKKPKPKDNSGMDIKIWMNPAVRNTKNVMFRIGVTNLTYFAEDSFKNEANCTFTVIIKDEQPPIVENCVDPPPFITNKNEVNIIWDEPSFTDNSGDVKVSKTHEFGVFKLGTTQVVYTAIDPSNNVNTCTLNITVRNLHCDPLPNPENGRSICESSKTSNSSGMQCIVTCDDGYALPFESISNNSLDVLDSSLFLCSDEEPFYYYSAESFGFPGCTITAFPIGISLDGIFNFEPENEEDANCEETDKFDKIKNEIENNLVKLAEAKEIDTDITCEKELAEKEEKTNVVKRETLINETLFNENKRRVKQFKKRKVRVYFKISKISNVTQNYVENFNEKLKNTKVIGNLQVNIFDVSFEKKILCPSGFMRRKKKCIMCPMGTFKNSSRNACQACPLGTYNDQLGQTSCKNCPLNYSTRKFRSKNMTDCKAHCPPGTIAKKKLIKTSKRNGNYLVEHTSLMPMCFSCPNGFYQPDHGQTDCIRCPNYYTTYKPKSNSKEKCIPTSEKICLTDPNVCNGGKCIVFNEFLYECVCPGDTIGSNCENRINTCDSNPCLNGGHCFVNLKNANGYTCNCPETYTGNNCEEIEEKCYKTCYNNGTCLVTDEKEEFCLCPPGSFGDSCQIKMKYCREGICENNATCEETHEGFICNCINGYLGKRCNILPCDYRPCESFKTCSNLIEPNATNLSYKCECPAGYEGFNCSTKKDFCQSNNPCRNGATCVSLNENFKCICDKIYSGEKCEVKMESNYIMHFQNPSTSEYVRLDGFSKNLNQVSVCFWMKTSDAINYGTIFSYATKKFDNAFTIMDYSGLVLYINNKYAVTDIYLNDGIWHFLCITWNNTGRYEVFVDGIRAKVGEKLSAASIIEGGGIMIIGQEQDTFGGMFSQTEAFVGKITFLEFWDRQLNHVEIKEMMNSCDGNLHGNLYTWAQMKSQIRGNIKIENSPFCTNCETPSLLTNGSVKVKNNLAFYECNAGFRLIPKIYSQGRKCLKSNQWEGKTPYCKKIYCGYPGHLENGRVMGKNFFYLGQVFFYCAYGYNLIGARESICTENGTWSSAIPHCIGKSDCKSIEKPENSNIDIILQESLEHQDKISFEPGTKIEIACNNQTVLKGEKILTCQENGFWDHQPPKCENQPKTCLVDNLPVAPPKAVVLTDSVSNFKNGLSKEVYFKCSRGFETIGNNFTTCIPDGYWTSLNMSCKPIECDPPPEFSKMKPKLLSSKSDFTAGKTVAYECEQGYRMFGNNVIRCLATKKWTKMKGKCIKISCYKPIVSDSTIIEGSSYLFEDQVTLTCPNGVKYKIICSSNGKWLGYKGDDC